MTGGGGGAENSVQSVEPDFRSPYSGTGFQPRACGSACLNRVCPCRPELTGAPLLLLCKSSLFLTGLGSQPRRRNFWRCTPRQTAAFSALNTPPPPKPPLLFERIARCASDGCVQTVAFDSRRCTPKLPQAFTDRPRTPGGPAPSCHSPVL